MYREESRSYFPVFQCDRVKRLIVAQDGACQVTALPRRCCVRANDDIDEQQYTLTVKQQLAPQDSVYVNAQLYYANSGDLAEYYNQNAASPTLRANEQQEPNVSLGYHHQWSPGVHTLFLAARLNDTTTFTNFTQPSFFQVFPNNTIGIPTLNTFNSAQNITANEHFWNRLDIYSGELQQILGGAGT